jgi:mono/diheme cytochrome c family protein
MGVKDALMTKLIGITVVLAFCLTVVYAGTARPAAQAAPAPATKASITNGAGLFKKHCQVCHGATGLGDGPASKTLKGKLPNFTDKAAMADIADDEILEAVGFGRKTTVGTMPPFEQKMKPEEIHDVLNFVRSLAK